jgi:hypothetical protein
MSGMSRTNNPFSIGKFPQIYHYADPFVISRNEQRNRPSLQFEIKNELKEGVQEEDEEVGYEYFKAYNEIKEDYDPLR